MRNPQAGSYYDPTYWISGPGVSTQVATLGLAMLEWVLRRKLRG